jgi:hypothetical protein
MLILDGCSSTASSKVPSRRSCSGWARLAAVAGGAYRLLGAKRSDRRRGGLLGAALHCVDRDLDLREPGGAFFIALAAWNLIEFARRGSPDGTRADRLFAGAAAGTKYFAAAAAAVLCVVGAIVVRDRLTLRRRCDRGGNRACGPRPLGTSRTPC